VSVERGAVPEVADGHLCGDADRHEHRDAEDGEVLAVSTAPGERMGGGAPVIEGTIGIPLI
jgi:hypothetical protein